jgi:hypothetical protein
MAKKLLFSAHNVHAAGCGTPPHVRQEAGRYQGYFENRYGEQWIFIFDYSAERGYLRRGGRAGTTSTSCRATALFPAGQSPIFNEEGQLWLLARCRDQCRSSPELTIF